MTVAHPLRRVLDRRVRALARHLPRAVEGDVRGVHQARVASRRLREAVPVLAAGLTGVRRRRTQRALRRVTRALGSVREMDVSLAAIAAQQWAPEDRAPADLVTSHLHRLRAWRRDKMLARLATIDRAQLGVCLRRIGRLASEPERQPAWRTALARRLRSRARALGSAVAEAGALYVPDRLHAVRVAVKKLRYALELAGEAEAADTAELVRPLKKVQDTLGRLHDLQVVVERVKAVRAQPEPCTVLPARLDDLIGTFETECRSLHGRYVAASKSLIALAETVTGRVVPAVAVPPSGVHPVPIKMALNAPRQRRGGR